MKNKVRWVPAQPKQTFELFYFTVRIEGEQVEIIQTPDEPLYAVSENVSLLTLPQTDVALHLTWLPVKPPAGSEARKLALAKVMVH